MAKLIINKILDSRMRQVWLTIIFCITGLFNHLVGQTSYQLAEQDSLALVAFYWATDGPNWTSNQTGFGFDDLSSEWQLKYDGKYNNWFVGPAKDWFGVRVERRPIANSIDSIDRVTWIWPVIGRRTDGQNQLKGYVPREVGLLTALEQFRVNGNDGFRWELVPDEIYHESLEHLDVEAAWFGGGLSEALRNSTGIRKLNTRYNYFDFMPNLDFLDEAAVRNLDGTQWFYNSRISYFYLERLIDYFYTISPTPKEFGFEARDMFDVGDEIEIVAPIGSSIEMICNDAGKREEFITYQWFKDGLSKFGKKDKTYSIDGISESDYGHYKTRITNEYVKSYDQNGNYGEVLTKGIYVVASPIPPTIERGVVANNGQYIDLYFTKPMVMGGFSDLQISAEAREVAIAISEVGGRTNKEVRLYLETTISKDEAVTLSYSSDQIQDTNEGFLLPFENLPLENRTRVAPTIKSAITTLDGSGILIHLDQYIDPFSFELSSFLIEGINNYSVSSVTLAAGQVDPLISKTILLTLGESIIDSAEVITLQYVDGKVAGLYAGSLQLTEEIPVLNRVTVDKTAITFIFEDGSETLENILLQGSWKVDPIQMFDDGTQGDKVAGDHRWTYQTSLVYDDYTWDVLSRITSNIIDTVQSVDSTTGNIVLTLVSTSVDNDSILSKDIILNIEIGQDIITGDTLYGILNKEVVFNVKVNGNPSEIYLMGIQGDWNAGELMEPVGNNIFRYTLPKKTAGDKLQYNYRNDVSWENLSPDPRSYLVVNGDNIIQDEFGIFTSTEEQNILQFDLYPNPTYDGLVYLVNSNLFKETALFNAMGKQMFRLPSQKFIDLSDLPVGIYFLIGKSKGGEKYLSKILKQ